MAGPGASAAETRGSCAHWPQHNSTRKCSVLCAHWRFRVSCLEKETPPPSSPLSPSEKIPRPKGSRILSLSSSGPTHRLRRWPNPLILRGFSWLFGSAFSSSWTAFSLSFSFRVNAGWFLKSQRRGHPYPHPFLVPRGGGQVSPLMPRVLRLCLGTVYNLGSRMAPGRESMHIYYIKLIILGQKIILKV